MSAINKLRTAAIALIDAAEPTGELSFDAAEEYEVPAECIDDLRDALIEAKKSTEVESCKY